MGHYTIQRNQTFIIDPLLDYRDVGWSISEGNAIHEDCNSGYMNSVGLNLIVGEEYTISFDVSSYVSGSVYVIVGGVQGQVITSNGSFTQNITPINNSGVQFYSDGELAVSNLVISQGEVDSVCFGFNQDSLKFTSYYSYYPEFMVKFLDEFFSFEAGQLWRHYTNDIRNNFYGRQYESKITFYVNIDPSVIKNFYSMRIKGNKPWSANEITIEPREGKSKGQRSRIKKGNFKSLQGDWFADFLRDMNDPRFSTELDALMSGAVLQGNVMKITITNNDVVEVKLVSIDVTVAPSNYTY